ncbi:N-acetylmuramoyl-L-alanine amidase family protein [Tepidibacter hydrothermalis]|uniref:N-acetylmuramoyl-L-alanine amidase n=1 Tax=Tepidibacter hydrothermalis TaxID=3036126 RepID=A0ABY8EBF8_9FIRM|nr:N-acetylmuramoyl-L-alanine amidase [Tepidibacter hydrothermalis]WFD08929.1 N-acetylmuramoyl-L-alanine amidase [Tepidibacter hydrothermalis]
MSGPLIIIDPGHGDVDPGCSYEDIYEKDIVLDISLYQLKRFEELGINAVITRYSDIYLNPDKRTQLVVDSKSIYCISNHINAGGGKGCEVIHSIHNDGKLAYKIFNKLIETGLYPRRVYSKESTQYPGQDYYFMHRNTGSCITNIVEYCFIDNQDDRERILKNWKIYAEQVIKAFCEYIDHPYENKTEYIDSVNNLYDCGFITTPSYWIQSDSYEIQYFEELVLNYTGKNNFDESIIYLAQCNIIDSPNYWLDNDTYSVENIQLFIIKLSDNIEYFEFADSVYTLYEYDVINSPYYWIDNASYEIRYFEELIINYTNKSTFEDGIIYLAESNVIDSPEYWLDNDTYSVENVRLLIIKLADNVDQFGEA